MKKLNLFLLFAACLLLITMEAEAQTFEKWRPTVYDPNYYYQRNDNDSTLATMYYYVGSLPNEVYTDSIPADTTTTGIIDTKYRRVGAIIFPATFTGATITILTSDDSTASNFKTLQYDGADFTVTASDGKQCALSLPKIVSLLRYIKYVSASEENATRVIKTVFVTF